MLQIADHQPGFLLWGGFWGKTLEADITALLPNLPYTTTDYYTNTVLPSGRVSLDLVAGPRDDMRTVRVKTSSFIRFSKTLEQTVLKKAAKGYDFVFPVWDATKEAILSTDEEGTMNLNLLNSLLSNMVANLLSIGGGQNTLVYENYDRSNPDMQITGENTVLARKLKTKKLVRYLQKVSTKYQGEGKPFTYLSGRGAMNYIDLEEVPKHITVKVQAFREEPSPVSMIVLLANVSDPKIAVDRLLANQYWESL